jgi:hypothetical protein
MTCSWILSCGIGSYNDQILCFTNAFPIRTGTMRQDFAGVDARD